MEFLVQHKFNLTVLGRSPIFTHVSTSIQGLTTIKALKVEQQSLSKFDDYQNVYNSVEYIQRALYFAYAYWVDFTCCLYSTAVIFYQLILVQGTSPFCPTMWLTRQIFRSFSWKCGFVYHAVTCTAWMRSIRSKVLWWTRLPNDFRGTRRWVRRSDTRRQQRRFRPCTIMAQSRLHYIRFGFDAVFRRQTLRPQRY